MRGWRRGVCAGILGLFLLATLAGPTRAAAALPQLPVAATGPPADLAGGEAEGIPVGRVAAWLAAQLGPTAEWGVLAELAPGATDLTPVVTAALDTWLRRRLPGADPLVLAGLPSYLATQALAAAAVWPEGAVREAVAARQRLLTLYRRFGLGEFALLPPPPPDTVPPAAYHAAAFLFWMQIDTELRLMGRGDLWRVVQAGETAAYTRRVQAEPAAAGPAVPPVAPFPVPPPAGGVAVLVAGLPLSLEPAARRQAGVVLAPVRGVAAALGGQVEYDVAADRIRAQRGDRSLSVRPGSRLAILRTPAGERRVLLPAPAAVPDGRALLPLQPLAEALGVAVGPGPGGEVLLTPEHGPAWPEGTLPPPSGRTAYLTFDDGPSGDITPAVLQVLAEYEAPATFFVGIHAERYPELLRRMAAGGHSIGTHSWDHDYQHVYPSPAALVNSLARAAAAIRAATGRPVRLARAPGGTGTIALRGRPDAPEYWAAVARAGYRLYDWNVDSLDSRRPRLDPAELLQTVQGGIARVTGGDVVVLFHDAATHENTARALPGVIEWLLREGFTLAALPDGP